MTDRSKALPGIRTIFDHRMTRFYAHSGALGQLVEIATIIKGATTGQFHWMVHMDAERVIERGTSSSRREAARAVRRAIRRQMDMHPDLTLTEEA